MGGKHTKAQFDYDSIPAGYYDKIFGKNRGIRSKWHHLEFNLILDPIRKAFRADGFRFSATGGPAYGWQASGFRLPTLPMSRY